MADLSFGMRGNGKIRLFYEILPAVWVVDFFLSRHSIEIIMHQNSKYTAHQLQLKLRLMCI